MKYRKFSQCSYKSGGIAYRDVFDGCNFPYNWVGLSRFTLKKFERFHFKVNIKRGIISDWKKQYRFNGLDRIRWNGDEP